MPDQADVVKTLYGPCHKCGKSIEEPDKPVLYRDNTYHEKCVPAKQHEAATDNSYTWPGYSVLNWLKHFMKPKERRHAGIHSALDYELQYRNYRAEGLRALAQARVKEAIDALGRAALFQSNDPVAHFDLGRALQLDGKTEAARHAYLRALDLNPSLSEVKNALLALPPLPPTYEDFHVKQRLKVLGTSESYRVMEIKKGGFGSVYIAIDERNDDIVALKTFQARCLWNDEDRKRFEREAITWIMLDRHPNIVTAHYLVPIEGMPCLVLEYMPYSLAELLRVKQLSPKSATELALQFCDGMFYAHDKLGIVHRDVKPSNCLLTEDLQNLKVTDFGQARTFAEAQERSLGLSNLGPQIKSQFTTVAGTPQYMSPEQFRAGAVLDTRSDIYSFGIMFYEMLTRDLPPIGVLANSHIAKHVTRYDVPKRLKQIIRQCVEIDPSKRPEDFGELRRMAAEAEGLQTRPLDGNHKTCLTQAGLLMEGLGRVSLVFTIPVTILMV